ncbi:hypothetical protein GCM10007301_48120 [Azorhizobium oxalatiphilum]|uniref:Uncharacterized protein n=1 Tax=Azorhizobium oxalatiphilum TaxID=980631 RepID=A0A917FIG6_9HYPH|nr:hypothetical protein GCM10007301_48120 [Azorhizobium oxalatiphilum]
MTEAQHHVKEDRRYGVDGFAQMAVPDRDGVSSRLVRQWQEDAAGDGLW